MLRQTGLAPYLPGTAREEGVDLLIEWGTAVCDEAHRSFFAMTVPRRGRTAAQKPVMGNNDCLRMYKVERKDSS